MASNSSIVHLDRPGGFVVKGLSKEPMTGNPPPRRLKTRCRNVNSIGLQNTGAGLPREKTPACGRRECGRLRTTVFGYTRAAYEEDVEIPSGEGIAALRKSTLVAQPGRTAAFSSAGSALGSLKSGAERKRSRRAADSLSKTRY